MKIFYKQTLFLIGNSKKKIPLVFALFLISAFFDLLGVGIMIPYIQIVTNFEDFIINYPYLKEVLRFDVSINNLLILFSIIILFIFLLKTFFMLIIQYEIIKFGERHRAELQLLLLKNSDLSAAQLRANNPYIMKYLFDQVQRRFS